MTARRRSWTLCGLAGAMGIATVMMGLMGPSSTSEARPQTLPAPDYLNAQSRARVKARMARHGTTMLGLVRAVVLLDHATSAQLADRIAEEEMVARVVGEGGVPLPEGFFQAQEQLRADARRLAQQASERNEQGMAEALGAVTRSCVACHQAYLHDKPPSP